MVATRVHRVAVGGLVALLLMGCATTVPPTTAPAVTLRPTASAAPETPLVSPRPDLSPVPSPSPTNVAVATPAPPFPSSVLGLPVVTVAQAHDLFAAGKLDGRDVAIAGYYSMEQVPCPYPGRYVGELEGWCRFAGFADKPEDAQMCQQAHSCSGPVDGALAPWLMSDTVGSIGANGDGQQTVPIVVVGHAADPRSYLCRTGSEAQCASDLVADQIVWVDGVLLDHPTPNTAYSTDGQSIQSSMTLESVGAALGDDRQIVSAMSTTADGVRSLDPRWNKTGKNLLWVVRSIARAAIGDDLADPTQDVTVSLVDDASGRVIESQPLGIADGYDPARLWVTVSHGKLDTGGAEYVAFYQAAWLHPYRGGPINIDSAGASGVRTYGPDAPLLLDAGTYQLDAWLDLREPQPLSQPWGDGCTTSHTFGNRDDVMINAAFSLNWSCKWSDGATPSFGY